MARIFPVDSPCTAIQNGYCTYMHTLRGSDTELGSSFHGTREVATVVGIGGCISFELYEHVGNGEAYEGRTVDGQYAMDWLRAAE